MKSRKFVVTCVRCNEVQSKDYSPFCQSCGGLTEAIFDLDKVCFVDSDNPYERYFDLIPVNDPGLLPNSASMTDTVHAKELGKLAGLSKLYLKNETSLPSGTTKYRMAAISLPYLYESGVEHFCTSSTGNSSTAYAQLIGNIPNLKMSLFTGDKFRNRVNYEPTEQITHYVLHGASFAEAFNVAAEFAKQRGYTSERGFFNLGRREGLKLAWLEATDQVPDPIDWYVQAVSSAMGVYGVYKASGELCQIGRADRRPKLLCVQQESCNPMVSAWKENSEQVQKHHIVENPIGIAKAILRGDPSRVYPYMREIVKESGGTFTDATEGEIREARQQVLDLEGIDICFSAATAVAGLLKLARNGQIDSSQTILINLTGSDRDEGTSAGDEIELFRDDSGWIQTEPETRKII